MHYLLKLFFLVYFHEIETCLIQLDLFGLPNKCIKQFRDDMAALQCRLSSSYSNIFNYKKEKPKPADFIFL